MAVTKHTSKRPKVLKSRSAQTTQEVGRKKVAKLNKRIIVIIAALVVVVIGFIYSNRQNANSQYECKRSVQRAANDKTPGKIYTDDSKTYRVAYPSNWNLTTSQATYSSPGPVSSDATNPSFDAGLTLPACARDDSADVPTITVDSYASTDMDAILKSYDRSNGDATYAGGFHPSRLSINGYSALYVHAIYQQSPTQGATYGTTIDYYAIAHNNTTLVFSFQESQTGTVSTPFDYASFVPIYTTLVQSVQFLK
jgi:hypothetical protein